MKQQTLAERFSRGVARSRVYAVDDSGATFDIVKINRSDDTVRVDIRQRWTMLRILGIAHIALPSVVIGMLVVLICEVVSAAIP